MSGKANKTFYIGIAVAIVLPLSFYIIAKWLKKDQLSMPPYYAVTDTIHYRKAQEQIKAGALLPVSDISAVNQFGDSVSLNGSLPGKILAVNFFFTTCTSTCPQLTQNIKMLERAFRSTPMSKNDTIVQFISFSVDPERDTMAALKGYAEKYKADQNHWWFLRGDKKQIFDWARNQLHLSVPAGDGGAEDFIHSNTIVLIDRDRFIRGYYDGLDTASIARCANDIGLLAMEKKH